MTETPLSSRIAGTIQIAVFSAVLIAATATVAGMVPEERGKFARECVLLAVWLVLAALENLLKRLGVRVRV